MSRYMHKCNIFGRLHAHLLVLKAIGQIYALCFTVYEVIDVNFIEVEPLISATGSHPGQMSIDTIVFRMCIHP